MKILHIWDCAGVANILAKYQRRLGHQVKVITKTGRDPFSINSFYGSEEFEGSAFGYKVHVLKESLKYDVIHIHAVYKIIPMIRLLNPRTKIIMHYHGSDARKKDNRKSLYNRLVDTRIVSTPDLLPIIPNSIYLPNIVDIEHFTEAETFEDWIAFYDSNSFDVYIPEHMKSKTKLIDRSKRVIPYKDMPDFLCGYYGIIDIKVVSGNKLKAYSSTGLQALSMGLNVMDYKENITNELPEVHKPKSVLEILERIYNE